MLLPIIRYIIMNLAIADLTNAIALKGNWQVYVYRGFVYEDLGMMSEAEVDWAKATKISKDSASVVLLRARYYRSKGRQYEAMEVLEVYLKDNPTNAQVVKLRSHLNIPIR